MLYNNADKRYQARVFGQYVYVVAIILIAVLYDYVSVMRGIEYRQMMWQCVGSVLMCVFVTLMLVYERREHRRWRSFVWGE